MRQHTPFFELQETFADSRCAICILTERALERYFSSLVYERVNDIKLREAIRKAYGFCAAHGAMLVAARSALGIAIVQRDVLRAAARTLAAAPAPGAAQRWRNLLGGQQTSSLFADSGPCPACELVAENVNQWANLMAQQYSELRPTFQQSAGLCLDHLTVVYERCGAETVAALREDQLTIWDRLLGELDTFIDGHDYQAAGAPVGTERDAWARATALVTGDRQVAGSLRRRSGV
jgi:hypothetical protein